MNERQIKFIEMLEKHVAQEVSLEQMETWLTENVKPIIFQSKAYLKPGMWLEMYVYREIHWYIVYLKDPTISRESNLDWYWEEMKRVLDLLLGHKVYKKTEYWVEHPLDHKRRMSDQWMLPYLEYIERVFQLLVTAQSKGWIELNLPKIDLVFEAKSLSVRSGSEMIMEEMLNIINDYEELITNWTNLPNYFHSIDLRSAQLSRLEKLIKCFKGELYYSVSATFEGLDKFTVTIIV
ncbi:MAG: hypothetical protein AB1801_14040 [Chloroflexota bacterium]